MEEVENKVTETEENCCCHGHVHNHEEHCHCDHEHGHEHNHKHDDGLHCSCCDDDHDDEEESGAVLKKIVISAVLFGAALLIEHLPFFSADGEFVKSFGVAPFYVQSFYTALYLVSYLLIGRGVITGAVKNIKNGNVFGEQFLMSVASIGAVFVGEFAEAVAVMLFYMIGEFFQDYAVDKSRDSISALMDIRPDHANVFRDGEFVQVSPEDVKIGETIEVLPGERIPLDGKILGGESFVDTSALTGESVPRKVSENDEVLAGFVNSDGVLKILVSKPYSESAVTRILNLTQQASSVKAKSEKFISRFAKVYTPIVCFSALAVALLPPLVLKFAFPDLYAQYGFSVWIYRALTFLVVSCPCALVISVPLSFFSGIGAESKIGVLVKGSNYMELLAKVKTAVFDKTGTLTKGVFEVSEVNPVDISREELLRTAALAESYSNHPISLSLKKAINIEEIVKNTKIENYQEISGHGVKVSINGKLVLAGNSKLMKKENVAGFEENQAVGTVVYVSVEGKFAGSIVISDEVKEDSKSALTELKKNGVRKTVMLTGDIEASAKAVAEKLGLDEYYAQLLPEDKVTCIEKLILVSCEDEKVLFVGDGINDSPVLARSDVGVAMGALGSDAAIEAADVVIMDDNLARLPSAIKIARKTVSIVRQNIYLSIGVKVLIMVLGAAGLANMWLAVFGDVGVCFIAILNAMRALSVHSDKK